VDVYVPLKRLRRALEASPARKNLKKKLLMNFDVCGLPMSVLGPFCPRESANTSGNHVFN